MISSPLPPDLKVEIDNYQSATNAKARPYVEAQIREEIDNGRYKVVHEKPQIISALGAIPKNKEQTKFRLIHDASRPYGTAINDFAHHDPFKYQSIQDAVNLIKPGDWLAKIDLQNSFRSVGIKVDNYGATGLKWRFKGQKRDTFFVDTRASFGAKRSPEIFNELSQSVLAIMRTKGFYNIVVYCDDFLIIASSKEECRRTMLQLMKVLRKLGFSINYNKVLGPAQIMIFLGIELNTIEMTLALPHEKLDEIRYSLSVAMQSYKMSKRGLQSLIGKLSWATQVIYGGRFHLRRLLDRISGLRYPSHRTRVTQEMRADMAWWLEFMACFNGITRMVEYDRPHAALSIDACPEAAGAHFQGDIVYTPWRQVWPEASGLHVNHLEVLALEPAAATWAPLWANRRVMVHSDNICAVHTINKGISKNSVVMASLRRVFWLSAIYNFRLKAVYYPGVRNTLADRASRLHEPGGLTKLQEAMAGACYL